MARLMTNDRDKILIRAKDIGLLIMIVTLMGFLIGPMKKVFQMEQTIEDVRELKIEASQTKTNFAVINSQYNDIQKQLEQMNWNIRRINHNKGD